MMKAKSRIEYYINRNETTAMPINNYNYVGPINKRISIDDTSRRIANSPGFEAKLRRYYKGCKWPINVFIINSKTRFPALGRGVVDMATFIKQESRHFPWMQRTFKTMEADKSINFIIAGDVMLEAPNSHPITPWMVGHRMGHGILESAKFRTITTKVMPTALGIIASAYTDSDIDFVFKCFTFKSSRKLIDKTELYHEIFTQWLIRGHVSLVFPLTLYDCKLKANSPIMQDKISKDFNEKIGILFTHVLDECVGQVVMD